MKRKFDPVTRRARILAAATALLATAGIVSSVLALAGHYDVEFLRVASAQSAVTAQRH